MHSRAVRRRDGTLSHRETARPPCRPGTVCGGPIIGVSTAHVDRAGTRLHRRADVSGRSFIGRSTHVRTKVYRQKKYCENDKSPPRSKETKDSMYAHARRYTHTHTPRPADVRCGQAARARHAIYCFSFGRRRIRRADDRRKRDSPPVSIARVVPAAAPAAAVGTSPWAFFI